MSDVTKFSAIFMLSLCMTIAGCGGGGGDGGGDGGGGGEVVDGGDTGGGDDGGDTGGGDAPEDEVDENAPVVTVTSPGMKQLNFSWDVHDGDEYYVLSQDPTGSAGFSEVMRIDEGTEATMDVSVHKHDGADTAFIVEACNANDECIPSARVSAAEALISAIGYFKASNLDPTDEFGQAVALSDDGMTMAVGAHDEQSGTGDEADNSTRSAGAVYVFVKGENGWQQQAYIKAEDIAQDDDFGHSIALSSDGNTLAIGAPWEEDTAADGDHYDTGAVFVFTREGDTWTQQGYLHASPLRTSGHFGVAVDLSDDGNRLAVGAYGRESGTPTEESDGSADTLGAAYIFTRTDGAWSQTAEVTASNVELADMFGYDIALSGDGSTLAVGAYQEGSAVVDNEADNTASQAGAVYVFGEGDSGWEQQAYLKASTPMANAHFGFALAISNTGDLLAVGAQGEDEQAGAVHVYARSEGTWTHQTRILGSNTESGDRFGADVALADDGSMLAVGATAEDSAAKGVGGDEASDAEIGSGAVYIFVPGEEGWTQTSYVKAPNTQQHAMFGHSVSLDATGANLAVGAIGEDGKSPGVGGDQAVTFTDEEVRAAGGNPVETGAGAVYLY